VTSTGHEHKPPTSRFLRGDGYLPAKRFLDVVFAFALLALFGPLMLLIVLAIKLESPGPAIFRQERVGLGEKTFTLLKFRTMRCEEGHDLHREHATRLIRDNVVPANSQETLKLKSDPRITRLGRILRRTSLDELPQFVNVLRGEMSLVGPRPPSLTR
jgi:lipopolysaccharide/colanic/teichoic acid biosynthesis glycosyltransferase